MNVVNEHELVCDSSDYNRGLFNDLTPTTKGLSAGFQTSERVFDKIVQPPDLRSVCLSCNAPLSPRVGAARREPRRIREKAECEMYFFLPRIVKGTGCSVLWEDV